MADAHENLINQMLKHILKQISQIIRSLLLVQNPVV